ncbi:MAG: FKBP-type peptidyl-prolyl cis-trans isomerase [Spirochaetaceae bacterium]|jgi:FKBP-type peptidyl-prolyl cis-trans isomerase|nr:FKBP-type peptidyl-prolyl cis-trans isomerase [Spirochaetaceae bacterium]
MVKKLICAAAMAVCVVFSGTAGGKTDAPAKQAAPAGADTDVSYAFGVVLGSDLKQMGIQFDYTALARGIEEVIEGKETRLTMEEAVAVVQEAYITAMTLMAEKNKVKNEAFMAENGRKTGVVTTASGLQYEVITAGNGRKPGETDVVSVNYKGSLIDGTVFDSSYDRGEPVEFPLNQVIPGWSEGIQLMNVGSTYRLYIPSDLAYGEQGAQNVIPPNSVLIFEVELLSIED